MPRTSAEASPLSTSRRMRRLTSGPTRSSSKRATSTELLGVLQEIVVFERLLRVKEKLVHGPEAALQRGCLGGGRRSERVRMKLDEREVPEGETNAPAQFLLDVFDRPKRLPGVRALVVAVLENQTSDRRPANVVDFLLQYRQTRPDVFRQLRLQVLRPPRRAGCDRIRQ